MSTADFKTGVYVLKIKVNGTEITERIVVQ